MIAHGHELIDGAKEARDLEGHRMRGEARRPGDETVLVVSPAEDPSVDLQRTRVASARGDLLHGSKAPDHARLRHRRGGVRRAGLSLVGVTPAANRAVVAERAAEASAERELGEAYGLGTPGVSRGDGVAELRSAAVLRRRGVLNG